MADVAKNCRSQAKSNFTRAYNHFNKLIDNSSPSELVKKQFEKIMSCWDKLEMAQDDFIMKTDIDVDAEEDGIAYLDAPGENHSDAMERYSEYLKTVKVVEVQEMEKQAGEKKLAEDERVKTEAQDRKVAEEQLKVEERNTKFDSSKAEVLSMVDAFNGMNVSIKDSLTDASEEVKREEWGKIETDFKTLQSKLVTFSSIDPTRDIKDVKDKFSTDAQDLFISTQKWILNQLKTVSNTSGGSSSTSSTSSSSSSSTSLTRREQVHLPTFKGDEVSGTPFLDFPTWKTMWDLLIVDYEERFHYSLLSEKIDAAAKSKFIGSENDYAAALKKLENYYGDVRKVVRYVLQEVMSQSTISEGQYYISLVSYSNVLVNNYNRLLSLKRDSEHEMTNSSAMCTILQKFPRNVREKWEEHLITKDSSVKLKPFTEFISWLSSQREIWERMVSTEESPMGGEGNQFGFYGNVSSEKE